MLWISIYTYAHSSGLPCCTCNCPHLWSNFQFQFPYFHLLTSTIYSLTLVVLVCGSACMVSILSTHTHTLWYVPPTHIYTCTVTHCDTEYSGQLEYCQWLVANRANLDAKDSSERTPYDNIAKVWIWSIYCANTLACTCTLCQVHILKAMFLQQENGHQDVGNYLTTYGEDAQQ